MKGISSLAVLLATQSAERAVADYSYCPVPFGSVTATNSGSGLRCDALVSSVTEAAVSHTARYDAARGRFSFAPCRFHLTQCDFFCPHSPVAAAPATSSAGMSFVRATAGRKTTKTATLSRHGGASATSPWRARSSRSRPVASSTDQRWSGRRRKVGGTYTQCAAFHVDLRPPNYAGCSNCCSSSCGRQRRQARLDERNGRTQHFRHDGRKRQCGRLQHTRRRSPGGRKKLDGRS
jgi:hypothetical protein